MSQVQIERTAFLIDGFNLYHSIKQAQFDMRQAGRAAPSMKWLNIWSLCTSSIHHVSRIATLTRVYYISAFATHLQAQNPGVLVRHQTLIRALEATGVTVEMNRFKEKRIRCNNCSTQLIRHEEKETDVALAVKLLELFITNACDTVVLVTGDTDVAPAIRTAKQLFPQKRVGVMFPYGRRNQELQSIADFSFRLNQRQYAAHQFPDPFTMPSGQTVTKPASW